MNVVLLLGPSSAGKSTICNELQDNQGWKVTGTDIILELTENERFSKKLEERNLYQKLSGYVTQEDIVLACRTGKLNITTGDPAVKHTFQFSTPDALEAEDFLEQARIKDPAEIKRLSSALREVGQVNKEVSTMPRSDESALLERLFDDAFDPSLDDDANVIIDTIPESTPEKTIAMIEAFEQRAKQSGRPIKISVVLAICPIDKLSERIQKRNEEADANDNPANKRLGLFPFDQLTSLMHAKVQENNPFGHMHATMGEVSRDQVMKIADKHKQPGIGSPIKKSKDGSERPVASKISQEGAVKVSDNIEAKHLVSKFDAHENEGVALEVRPGIKFDAVIDTTKGTSKENAEQVVNTTKERNKNTLD